MTNKNHNPAKWLWLSLLVIVVDQVSKYFANLYLYPDAPVKLLPFLNLNLRYNNGAAFSFLAGTGNWHHYILAGISIVVSILLIVWLLRSRHGGTTPWALSLIIGGALGNLVGCLWQGYVTDFIDFHVRNWHFATFNIADSAITLGVILLLFTTLTKK